METDEEDDGVDKGATLLDQKTTTMKTFPSGTFGCLLISEGHRDVSPPKFTTVGTLGKPKTFGEICTSKRSEKVPLDDAAKTSELGISKGPAPV